MAVSIAMIQDKRVRSVSKKFREKKRKKFQESDLRGEQSTVPARTKAVDKRV